MAGQPLVAEILGALSTRSRENQAHRARTARLPVGAENHVMACDQGLRGQADLGAMVRSTHSMIAPVAFRLAYQLLAGMLSCK
jgi:hypothetical protein